MLSAESINVNLTCEFWTLGRDNSGIRGGHVSHRIAGVDDQRSVLGDPLPVISRMVGHDEHAISRLEVLGRQILARHTEVWDSVASTGGPECGIIVLDHGPFFRRSSISSKPGDSRGSSTSFL